MRDRKKFRVACEMCGDCGEAWRFGTKREALEVATLHADREHVTRLYEKSYGGKEICHGTFGGPDVTIPGA